ncbi:MAG TPA: hypothetical protein VK893_10255 [Pyrinomonadaceae bacterium]|nr:hypothetical protein [Pyrinomonadaceae bacterium]
MGRIVVNIEPGKTPARRKPRRWLRILAIVSGIFALIVVAATVGGFLWWRNYQSTPVYSLALLLDAAEKGDQDELAKFLDREEIVRNMMAKVSQKAVSRYGGLMSTSAQQQIEQTVTSLPNLNQTIDIAVVSEIQAQAVELSQPFSSRLMNLPSQMTIAAAGDTAKASGKLSSRPVELTLRRDANRWKVTSFDDDVVVQRIVDKVMKDLPPMGALDATNPLFKMPGSRPRKRRR